MARRRRRDAHTVRRAARRAPAERGVHRALALGLPATDPDQYPLLLHFPYFELYRKQVVKQADLVLAMHLRGDAFTRRAEAAQLRVLRAAHGARLVAVLRPASGDRRRSRSTRARARLHRRDRARRSARPQPQHRRRPAHRLARLHVDRARRRTRRHAGSPRPACVRAAIAEHAHPPRVPRCDTAAVNCS